MSHIPLVQVDIDQVVDAGPLQASSKLKYPCYFGIVLGVLAFLLGISGSHVKETWGVYYINFVFFLGLSLGTVMTTVIFQIVRAKWSASIRRIAEASSEFLPIAFGLFVFSYLGKEYLFPWATSPMPGREWWMQPNFVYIRFFVLFLLLIFLLKKFVYKSLRSDIGFLSERGAELYQSSEYLKHRHAWSGTGKEVLNLQRQMSFMAPVLIIAYVVIFSLFCFEMIMGMDTIWFSNMFGGFMFVGNIYMGWATLAITVILLSKYSKKFDPNLSRYQLWDLGKLTLGFAILWGYMFLSQYLPQWYGNMPEETQWIILRTRGHWQPFAYLTLAAAFILPVALLLSEDVKKNPKTYLAVCVIALFGVWMEKYMVITPSLTHHHVPWLHGLPLTDIAIFLGFLSAYVLSVAKFLAKYPFVAVSHPLSHGSVDW